MGLYSEVIFPTFFDLVVRHKVFDQRRKSVLQNAEGRVLEIGAGTGINLDYYPEKVTKISVVEPNPGMKKQFQKKAEGHRIQVDFHLCGAEKMPFESNSFDTVISTITLCSIPKLQEALVEIKRVLKPNGIFIFLDHGLSDQKSTAWLQQFINPVYTRVGVGCQLTRNFETELLQAGFHIADIRKYQLENAPKFIGFVYEGIAVKTTDKKSASNKF